jgi:hypothetical protein
MTTPPILRIYRGLPAELAGDVDDSRPQRSKAAPLYAVAFSAAIHLLVLAGSTFLATLQVSTGVAPFSAILATTFMAFILAQCGLGAILFARSSWPLCAKAFVATLIGGGLWLTLVRTMAHTRDSLLAAQAWAASFALIVTLVIAIVSLLELSLHYERAAAKSRFSLFHVLAATTCIAIALGLSRNFAAREGFVLADVLHWQFFQQVLLAGCTSATLAVAIYASLRLPHKWQARALFSALVLIGVTIAAPLAFQNAFGDDAGASLTDMRWLFGTEGLFLLGTLVPLQILGNDSHISK